MCVEILHGTETKKRVVAYKLFKLDNRKRLIGLCFGASYSGSYSGSITDDFYCVGKKYKTRRPGFQAFKTKADAKANLNVFGKRDTVLRKVVLYDAQLGVIRGMSFIADDKPGWAARAMRILPATA